MTTFTVELSPGTIMEGADGSLDTARDSNSRSVQRSAAMLMVKNGANLMIVGNKKDGVQFTDTAQTLADLDFIV